MRAVRRRPSLLLGALLAAPLGACTAITGFDQFRGGGGGLDAGSSDVGSDFDTGPRPDTGLRPDTGMTSTCTPTCLADEECCDGACADLLSDPNHCGECGMVCPDRDNSTPACDERGCDFDCEDGFDDCDAEDSNGCEQRLNTIEACGRCDNTCSGATPVCNGATGTCVSGCSASEMECDGTCVDVMGSDVTHCGSCTTVCDTPPGAARACAAGRCTYTCEAGRLDCDRDLGSSGSNGCESVDGTYYVDLDGDGFGAGPGRRGCIPSTGASSRAGDCNDTDRAINPRADEVCSGLDDDCDGVADETFTCARGTVSSCAGTGSTVGCSFTGTQSCDPMCNPGECRPPPEACDGVDQNCDGFVDEGALLLGPAVGGFADGTPGARFVAAAWRSAEDGGAALVLLEDPVTGARELRFLFVDPSGAPAGTFFYRVSTGSASTGLGVNQPADLAWDGSRWVVFFMHFVEGTGGEIRRVTITPGLSGSMSEPVTEARGMSSVAVARSPTGDVGVVFGRYDEVRTGVWRAGAWARTPIASITGRTTLDYAQVTAIGGGGFMALTSDVGTTSPALLLQRFDAMRVGGIETVLTGTPRVDGRLGYHAPSERVILAWRDSPAGAPFAARWNPVLGALDGSIIPLGTGNAPRIAAGAGDIFLAPGPGVRRLRSDGALYPESLASSVYVDVILPVPGSPSSAMVFAYDPGVAGPATRRLGCL
ncbi:MAG: MopE-related protein [Deltaproteobacteria bacterium]|jgi:hypothetical protein